MQNLPIDIQWARGEHGPLYAASGVTAACYDCGQPLVGVKEHTKTRNGISYQVCAHFRHKTDSTCAGETWQHKAAKHRVATENFRWYMKCVECNCRFDVKIEGTAVEEKHWHAYYLDVAFMQGDRVTGAVEVCQTHASDDCKCTDMTINNLAWIEVSAQEVLNSKTRYVQGIRAARSVCHECDRAYVEASKLEPIEFRRLHYYKQEKDKLLKRKREDEQARYKEEDRTRKLLWQVQAEVERLKQCQAHDTGANNVVSNTMRQRLMVARRNLDSAEECAKSLLPAEALQQETDAAALEKV